jgi:hypothetical protein
MLPSQTAVYTYIENAEVLAKDIVEVYCPHDVAVRWVDRQCDYLGVEFIFKVPGFITHSRIIGKSRIRVETRIIQA